MFPNIDDLASRGHRQLLVISAESLSDAELIPGKLQAIRPDQPRPLWFGSACPAGFRQIAHQGVQAELGTEHQLVVINAREQFDCDVLAALSGTLIAGGVLCLLTSPLRDWPQMINPFSDPNLAEAPTSTERVTSRYLTRLCQHIEHKTTVISKNDRYEVRQLHYQPEKHPQQTTETTRTSEQRDLIAKIQSIADQRTGNLLLTADRGRGKSAALGMAIAELMTRTSGQVALIAPTKRSIAILYKHFNETTNHPDHATRLVFLPPDQLDQLARDFALVVVDEAATLPVSLLNHIAASKGPTVFSTTVNGYEGAGRGFSIRFARTLQSHADQKHDQTVFYHSLNSPIRWADNDPLESFCTDSLLLSRNDSQVLQQDLVTRTSPNPLNCTESTVPTPDELLVEEVQQDQLAEDERLLQDVFELLLQAHYRTKPRDVWHLLDGPNLRIFTVRQTGHLVGAAMIAKEGPIHNPQLRDGIIKKLRRPKGHLLPQLMSQYLMSADPLDMTFARIVRIAVLPSSQRTGIGSHLLARLPGFYESENLDAMGATFGGAPDTVNFWQHAGYHCCHIAASAQTSNGYQSVSMIKPYSGRAHHARNLAVSLHQDKLKFLQQTDPGQPTKLTTISYHTSGASPATPMVSAELYDDYVLRHYCNGSRSLDDSRAAIHRRLKSTNSPRRNALSSDQNAVIHAFLHDPGASMTTLASHAGLTGKKQTAFTLRRSIAKLLSL